MSIKKITQNLILVALLSVSSVAIFFSISQAQTPPMTEEQIARIRSNCVSAKNSLAQLHTSDGLLRVNRGQLYLSLSSKLMAPFDSRLAGNRFDAKAFVSVTNNYKTAFTTFYNDYIRYEQSLSAVLRIDCVKEPVAFYDGVADARNKRSQVHADVIQLHTYIDEYKVRVDAFDLNATANREDQ